MAFGLILVAFDAIAASIAQAARFNYGQFILLGLVVYVGLGIFAGQRLRWQRALAAILIAALIDASLGSYVAALIGPGRPVAGTPVREILAAAFLGALFNAIFGAIGVFIGGRVARRSA